MKEIMHFTADWCMPCKRLKPIIEEFVDKNPEIKYTRVDVDKLFDVANEYSVQSVPTIVVLTDGIETARHIGLASYDKIGEMTSDN